MRYARYTDLLRPTWTLPVGTARDGYEASHLGNLEPDDICWIEETTIRLVTDLGAATPLAVVALINHTFEEDLTVLVQAHTADVWTAPDLSEEIPILAPYRNGFPCHALIDLTALFEEAGRTFRYWSVTNVGDANDRTVAIGEIVLATDWRSLDVANGYQKPHEQVTAQQRAKKGVQTVYDFGTRGRSLKSSTRGDAGELDAVMDFIEDQHAGTRPLLLQLDAASATRRHVEPWLARYVGSTITPVGIGHDAATDVTLDFEEMGCGELVGA